MLRLEQAARHYGGVPALAPIDLDVAPGRTLVVIGPSGCGKTTLLGLMNGLVRADQGRVLFDGEPLGPKTLVAVRRRMGYVIQEGGLFPHLTAGGNVTLLARILDWSNERMQARLSELARITHFPEDGLGRYPLELSGGQRQRVSLMRALMLDPDVLLLDEPLGALDPLIRFELQNELRDIFRTLGKTVVLVTHDMSEAAFFADSIILLRDGRVVQRGSVDDLMQRPADPFVTRFINAQRARWSDDAGEAP
ncbi:MAG: ABC transporter ATP-binding protein [Betaproteobacteria bacterium RIFCSPLOWO2_12_FULL_63_13]|nr:MAG: ABC transporter ATP-binding protein [Betaproteobacteria bacterium RIFCSPLOWO2_12_FULL_63_13]